MSTLSEWNQVFNGNMVPLVIPENSGKKNKITADIVRQIVEAAKEIKGRLRLKTFVRKLSEEYEIDLGRKTVTEVLIANGIYKTSVRRKRPDFYQQLRQTIPNGLISVDGSEFKVLIDDIAYKFNLELGVDVESFYHTAFSISESETTKEFIKVMETHKALWGTPLGLVSDHGSANLSGESMEYLRHNNIEILPAGPGNPKGNGTCEGAFSEMKEVIGRIELDISSPKELGKAVLEKIISIYIKMRNRAPRFGEKLSPIQNMKSSVSKNDREEQRNRYKKRIQKEEDPNKKAKLDHFEFIINHHRLEAEENSLKRGRKCIISYDLDAISKSEEAFLKAIRRDRKRATLPYFFGILKNIQNEMDTAKYEDYCYQRYGYEHLLEKELEQQEWEDNKPTVESLVSMIKNAVLSKVPSLTNLIIKRAKKIARDLKKEYCYLAPLKKKIMDTLSNNMDFTFEQLKNATSLMEEILA